MTKNLGVKTITEEREDKSEDEEDVDRNEPIQTEDLDDTIDESVSPDMQCSFGDWKCTAFQRYATQTSFIIVFGLLGCVMEMTYAYFNGTITTLEKRFHLSSRSIGITQIGKDFMNTVTSLFFIHYISKKHRPRWMALGVLAICLFCFMTTLPHWIYGPGEDALKLTAEFGGFADENPLKAPTLAENSEKLCHRNTTTDQCQAKTGPTQVGHSILILFLAQVVSGFGMSIFYTLGYTYMDDNVERSKTASMYSFSLFLNLLGPSCGYTLASFCLRYYVSPHLSPVIDDKDPRWVGAWWLGWLVFAALLFIASFVMAMFPKVLPAQYKRQRRRQERSLLKKDFDTFNVAIEESSKRNSSFREFLETLERILKNRIFMCNNMASVFFCFGYMPYWIFTPKYLEIVFRQSAANSNVYTGTVALVFTALGVLVSGAIVSWKKPRARILAGWNAITGIWTVMGFLCYSLIGCPGNENSLFLELPTNELGSFESFGCAEACHCEFVPYEPVCGENNLTYISACHAGCKGIRLGEDGSELFYDCECVAPLGFSNDSLGHNKSILAGVAVPGSCPANCFKHFVVFLVIMCSLKFIGSTSNTSYFLIQMRAVAVEDKTIAIAVTSAMLGLLSFVPAPIFFGWIFDRMCLVWGKTCSEESNCWLYDSKRLRHTLNYTALIFLIIGSCFDCMNCFLVKNLVIYEDDDDEKKTDKKNITFSTGLAKLDRKMSLV